MIKENERYNELTFVNVISLSSKNVFSSVFREYNLNRYIIISRLKLYVSFKNKIKFKKTFNTYVVHVLKL